MNCEKCKSAMRDLSVTGVSLWHCDACEAKQSALATRQAAKVEAFSMNYAQGMGAAVFAKLMEDRFPEYKVRQLIPQEIEINYELTVPAANYDLIAPEEPLPAYDEIRAEMMADMEQAIGQPMGLSKGGVFETLINAISRQLAALHASLPDEEDEDEDEDEDECIRLKTSNPAFTRWAQVLGESQFPGESDDEFRARLKTKLAGPRRV